MGLSQKRGWPSASPTWRTSSARRTVLRVNHLCSIFQHSTIPIGFIEWFWIGKENPSLLTSVGPLLHNPLQNEHLFWLSPTKRPSFIIRIESKRPVFPFHQSSSFSSIFLLNIRGPPPSFTSRRKFSYFLKAERRKEGFLLRDGLTQRRSLIRWENESIKTIAVGAKRK